MGWRRSTRARRICVLSKCSGAFNIYSERKASRGREAQATGSNGGMGGGGCFGEGGWNGIWWDGDGKWDCCGEGHWLQGNSIRVASLRGMLEVGRCTACSQMDKPCTWHLMAVKWLKILLLLMHQGNGYQCLIFEHHMLWVYSSFV